MATLTNNGICRCCASEGTFKDVRSVYVWMGEEEIYADMLKECFDITLSAQEGLSGVCEVCVTQLRNARNFKRQVLDIEDRFRRHLFDDLLNRECTPAPHSLLVKMEVQAEGHSESEPDDVDDEDYTPEFKEVPVIKREASEEPKAKRRAKTTAKKKEGCVVVTVRNYPTQAKDAKDQSRGAKERLEMIADTTNLRHMLVHSNATLIRSKYADGYSCYYCRQIMPFTSDLKAHTLINHEAESARTVIRRDRTIKLDITNLTCSDCGELFNGISDLSQHLRDQHKVNMKPTVRSQIVPFKFDSKEFCCVICKAEFPQFRLLVIHMSSHYNNNVCSLCGAGFVTKIGLKSHVKAHDSYPCDLCGKVYKSIKTRSEHVSRVHLNQPVLKKYKCVSCSEPFSDFWGRERHMIAQHGSEARTFGCKACDRVFSTSKKMMVHVRRDHLRERNHICAVCGKGFFQADTLREHMLKHTGVKVHACKICNKSFGRRYTLVQHMRSHAGDRRFKCEHCAMRFVQKCSLKSHLSSKHSNMYKV